MFFATFSSGCPFFSYRAKRKNGSIRNTMMSAAVLVPMYGFVRKKSGTPTSAPPPKQTSCRFVRLNRNLVLTWVRSLGTGTYAIVSPPSVRPKQGFRQTSGFEQREAQQHRIPHTSPDSIGNITRHRYILYQCCVNRYTDDNKERL